VSELIELAEKKLVVEAYPCQTRFSGQPPWENRLTTSRLAADQLRVVVAHGTLQGGPVPEGETDAYPFTQAAVEALGADYVALGHFHGVYPPWTEGDECGRAFCYCGTHEPDQFGGDAGYAILATLAKGDRPRLRRVKVGRRQWSLIQLAGSADLRRLEDLRKQVETSGDPGRFVIRLKLVGRTGWATKDSEQLDRLEAGLRALGAQVERRGDVRARVEVGNLDLYELPSGAIQEALLSLQAELQETTEENRREVLAAAVQIGWEKVERN
jgi:DNA repair exonuclease SbcCD nuclease subunit